MEVRTTYISALERVSLHSPHILHLSLLGRGQDGIGLLWLHLMAVLSTSIETTVASISESGTRRGDHRGIPIVNGKVDIWNMRYRP